MKNTFYMMVGNIGSGKTTYRENKLSDAIVISKDSIRYSLGGGTYVFDRKLEPIVHSTTMYLTNRLCTARVEKIVLDETNMQRRNRKKFIDIAKDSGYEVVAIVLPIFSKSVSVTRRLTDPHSLPDRDLWEGVWEKFNSKFQYPKQDEGFDKVVQLCVNDVIMY